MADQIEKKMTQEQMRFLKAELARARGWGFRPSTKEQLPKRMYEWQKKIDAYHTAERKRVSELQKEFDADGNKVLQEIHFGTAESALAALEAFKKKYSK